MAEVLQGPCIGLAGEGVPALGIALEVPDVAGRPAPLVEHRAERRVVGIVEAQLGELDVVGEVAVAGSSPWMALKPRHDTG